MFSHELIPTDTTRRLQNHTVIHVHDSEKTSERRRLEREGYLSVAIALLTFRKKEDYEVNSTSTNIH